MTDQPNPRIETGSIQFGSDWPGFFFRGDDAVPSGIALGALLDQLDRGEPPDPFNLLLLRELQKALMGASVDQGPDGRQFLKPAAECRKGPDVDPEMLERLRALGQKVIDAQKRQPTETIVEWATRLAAGLSDRDD